MIPGKSGADGVKIDNMQPGIVLKIIGAISRWHQSQKFTHQRGVANWPLCTCRAYEVIDGDSNVHVDSGLGLTDGRASPDLYWRDVRCEQYR